MVACAFFWQFFVFRNLGFSFGDFWPPIVLHLETQKSSSKCEQQSHYSLRLVGVDPHNTFSLHTWNNHPTTSTGLTHSSLCTTHDLLSILDLAQWPVTLVTLHQHATCTTSTVGSKKPRRLAGQVPTRSVSNLISVSLQVRQEPHNFDDQAWCNTIGTCSPIWT